MGEIVNVEEIGVRIRSFRQTARMSQEKLAEAVGVTAQQIQKYETGRSKISTDKIQLIAEALQVHVSVFFQPQADAVVLNDTERNMVKTFRRIKDSEARQTVLTMMEKLAGK